MELFKEPGLSKINPDSSDLLDFQKKILSRKNVLKQIFVDLYTEVLSSERKFLKSQGSAKLEIGAGVSLLKTLDPEYLITDIKAHPHLDRVIDASKMPFPENSIHSVVGINCFHHFPDVTQFFREMDRCLAPGAGVLLVEPYESWLGKILYPRMFKNEGFDLHQKTWDQTTLGPMVGANQALSFVVFERDFEKFRQLFPRLELVEKRPLPFWSRYLFSGGFNFRQLLPSSFFSILKVLELWTHPWLKNVFSLHVLIVLRKKS